MGVYIFKSLDSEWVKVGHHQITDRRPNVYYRYAGRGFHSCNHPVELKCLSLADFELVAWYPDLTTIDEKAIHKSGKAYAMGEFHPLHRLEDILKTLDAIGLRVQVGEDEKQKAIQWSRKRSQPSKVLSANVSHINPRTPLSK